jgi:hypothetical protein
MWSQPLDSLGVLGAECVRARAEFDAARDVDDEEDAFCVWCTVVVRRDGRCATILFL